MDDAQRCVEEKAYVPAPAAQREAGRAKFNLRAFHERILTNGIAPIWAHRQLLLPGDNSEIID